MTAGGSGATSIATAIAAMGAQWFNTIVCAFNDDTNMDLLEADLDTRWGPMVMQDCQCFIGANVAYGSYAALGNGRNSKLTTYMGGGLSPTPPWVWASVAAAADCAESDPARPRQTLALTGCKPPAHGAEFTWLERNTLLSDGISTYKVTPSGDCIIDRLITTYQLSPAGASDTSYLNIETMRTLAYLRYSWNAWVNLRYPRHKLADDGTVFGAGQAIVTPAILTSEALVWFKELELLGLAENFEQFKAEVVVERNATDRDRVDMRLSPDIINCFRVLATQIQFIL
jgi:phage tail sheath gpL-like